ncbi:MAG: triose-phosphate isomerase [Planctomycetota bacterium]|jgi:triosephosphate isomerase
MRRPFMAGNWKMYKDAHEAVELAKELKGKLADAADVDIGVCVNAVALAGVAAALEGSNIAVGAQNLHWEAEGAFTGEISAKMILSAGATLVTVGHSERRHIFGETNEEVRKKLGCALEAGLRPILCVGEKLDEREAGDTENVVRAHVESALSGRAADEVRKVTIAYEPVWAIGTGKTATPEIAQEVHGFIRKLLADGWDDTVAREVRIQYGGSVKSANVDGLMAQEDVDGALVGGASLKADSFERIVKFGRA